MDAAAKHSANIAIMAPVSPFEKLPEITLRKIFAYLPLKKRIRLGRTCNRFLSASRDTCTKIHISEKSSAQPGCIEKLLVSCPKAAEICMDDLFEWPVDTPANLPVFPSLRALKLFSLGIAPHANNVGDFERNLTRYFEQFPGLEELWWNQVYLTGTAGQLGFNHSMPTPWCVNFTMPALMASSLRRLVLSNGGGCMAPGAAIQQMPNLECLYLGRILSCFEHTRCAASAVFWDTFMHGLSTLTNLRELCLGDPFLYTNEFDTFDLDLQRLVAVACENLAKLEVLMVASSMKVSPDLVRYLITAETSLHILVIAGTEKGASKKYAKKEFVPTVIPPPKIRPDPSNPNTRLPPLQIFVGGEITRGVRFTKPQAAAAKFWLIDCKLAEYLAKPEVAEIFDGVWLAKVLREMPPSDKFLGDEEEEPAHAPDFCASSLLFHEGQ